MTYERRVQRHVSVTIWVKNWGMTITKPNKPLKHKANNYTTLSCETKQNRLGNSR